MKVKVSYYIKILVITSQKARKSQYFGNMLLDWNYKKEKLYSIFDIYVYKYIQVLWKRTIKTNNFGFHVRLLVCKDLYHIFNIDLVG